MKNSSALILALTLSSASAFQTTSLATQRSSSAVRFAYIPDGFTKESYAKFKSDEAKKAAALKKKNLGSMGPKGFQSRSFQSFQEALEKGETTHLMPVFNAKEKVRKGELKVEDIPYMQRGGSWDNSDVKGAKKNKWLKSDKEYATGGFRKEQSVSIFGYGAGLDWTGSRSKTGPESVKQAAPKFGKNYKAPNVNDIKKSAPGAGKKVEKPAPKKGGFFGMF